VRAFSRAYDQVNQVVLPPPPPAVWEPVWCSWYGIKNDVDAAYIRGMAPLLKEWGIGNIIVDAGWFKSDGFDLDRGHYVPDESKFPDLKGLVEEVQGQGLSILLWCAPLFNLGGLGEVSFIQDHLFRPTGQDAPEGFLCPRSPAVRAYACRMVKHLMEIYGCNGLKIDFIDPLQDRAALPCTADHEHDIADYGEAVERLLNGIYQAATQVRADALLEYRMNYSTLATRPFATSHRAQDAPFDPDHIRRMCTRLKSYMLDPAAGRKGNVAVHTDPAYWLPEESPENVARFMASLVLSAVPMMSMDLRALPVEHQYIVRAWLAFYREHRDLLLFGRQQILSADPHHSLFWAHAGDEALLAAFTPDFPGLLAAPEAGIRRVWIVNGSAQERLYGRIEGVAVDSLQARVYDRGLAQAATCLLPVADHVFTLDLTVEIGGAVELVAP
jgi:alpha-galactosidase